MLPEHVPVTTSVTTSRPVRWETPLGIFDLRHIQIPFFDGFRVVDLGEKQQAFIATPDQGNWRDILCQRLGAIDWKKSASDVRLFLERPHEVALITQENFEQLLGSQCF